MANAAVLAIRIVADATKASKVLDQTSKKAGGFQKGIKSMALPAAAIVGGLVAIGKQAGTAASELEQAQGGVEAVFKGNSKLVKSWAADADQQLGLSETSYENLAAVIGSQMKSAGTSMEQLAPKTDDLIRLGADLAATYGGTTADAVGALSSLLRGERDPIEKYGVSIKQSDIDAQQASKGLKKLNGVWNEQSGTLDDGTKKYKALTGAASKQSEQAATLAILTKQTAAAQGQFARESDTASGAQARSNAEMENATATLGTALLPYMAQFAGLLSTVAQWVEKNTGLVQILAIVLGIAAGAILAINVAMGIFNAIMAANPVVLVVVAMVALAVAFFVLYKKSAAFRKIVDAVFKFAKQQVQTFWAALQMLGRFFVRVGSIAAAAFHTIMSAAKAVWSWISRTWHKITELLGAPIKAAVGIVRTAMHQISSFFSTAFSAIGRFISPITSAMETLWGWIQKVIDLLGKIKVPKVKLPFGIGGKSGAPAAAPPVPGLFAVPAPRSTSTSGAALNVNVFAVDPQQTARLIQRMTHNADVRAGRKRFA